MKLACATPLLLLLGCVLDPRLQPKERLAQGQPAWFPTARCQAVQPPERTACYKSWTVLIYMAADNDLAPYAYLNLYELEASGGGGLSASSQRTDAVVQLDTPGPRGLRRLHMLPVGAPYD